MVVSVVGPEGFVVATDLETRFLAAIESPNLEVREHNIVMDPLEHGAFDLVHSRAVLDHLPERDQVLRRLIDTLKPGGWLVLVGADLTAVRAVGLPSEEAHSAGLSDVVTEGAVVEWNSEHPLAQLYTLTFQRLKARALDEGAITANDHERLVRMMTEPDFVALSHTIFAARGRVRIRRRTQPLKPDE